MTRADVYGGLLLAAGFGAALWEASSFQYGTEFAPGPGFAPVWLSAIGIGLSLLIALNAFNATRRAERSAHEDSDALDKPGLFRVGATLAGLVAMMAIAPWLGLVPSILLFLLFLTLYVQRLSVVAATTASVATVFFVYVIFVRLLDVPVASGPLGF
jgi:putative tricarboxylic transport membrane protein